MARLQRENADLREECERTAARLAVERERCVDAEAARARLAAQAAVDQSRCNDLELELATTNEVRMARCTCMQTLRCPMQPALSNQLTAQLSLQKSLLKEGDHALRVSYRGTR